MPTQPAAFARPKRGGSLRNERGQALVEFALASLLLFMLLFGILEGSRAVFYYNSLASLARDGARFAIVRGSDSGRETNEAAVRTFVQGRAVGLTPSVSVTWTPDTRPGSTVQVQVNHTFTSVAPFLGLGPNALTATSQMTVLR